MTESDLPYIKPESEIPPEANEVVPPSPDVKNPLPYHDPIEKEETAAFICPVCGNPSVPRLILICIWQKTMGKQRKPKKAPLLLFTFLLSKLTCSINPQSDLTHLTIQSKQIAIESLLRE
jgi:acyl-CoA synthetase (NDP forming)